MYSEGGATAHCPTSSHEMPLLPSGQRSRDRLAASQDGFATRRRRECLDCKQRYTTYERIEGASVKIIKKDGTREPFDR